MNLFKKYLGKAYIILIISSFSLTFCSSPAESDNLNYSDDLEKIFETTATGNLNPAEEQGLIFMREEEKLARDVYITLYEKWNMNVFNNISQSEQKHTDAIKFLLDRYGLEDPMTTDEIGHFENDDLQNLYDDLVEKGDVSLDAALRVGCAIEEIDILDLEKYISEIEENEDIILVYDNLLRGSRNHLRAFVRNIENQGSTYSAQYMTPEAYDIIISNYMERGGNGKGRGKGRRGRG